MAARGGARPYLWMLGGSASFAVMACLASELRHSCDWRVTALARSGLAFLLACLLCRAAGARLVVWRPPVLWLRSVAGSLSLLCTFYAFSRLGVEEVLTLTNTFPIWVALLSWPALRQAPGADVWAAAVCAVVGVALIQQPRLATGENGAVALALAAAVSSAVAMLGLNRLAGLDTRAVVAHFSGVSALFVAASFLVFDAAAPAAPVHRPAAVAALLGGVGVAATVGQLCLTEAFTAGPPSQVAVVGLVQIVFAMGLEQLYRPRAYNGLTLLGMALTLAPTAWVLTRGARRRRRAVAVEATALPTAAGAERV